MVSNMTENKAPKGQYILYTSSTCGLCPLARRKLEQTSTDYEEIVLDAPGNQGFLASFREMMDELDKGHGVPVIVTNEGEVLTNLAEISRHFSGRGQ